MPNKKKKKSAKAAAGKSAGLAEEKHETKTQKLRFEVDQRVECHMPFGWANGVIIKHQYRENSWPPGCFAPYQIRLDSGDLIFATRDNDNCVRIPSAIADVVFGYDSFEDDSDINLDTFELPPRPDCPVCCVPMPIDGNGVMPSIFMQCCGKSICKGCWCESSHVAKKRGIPEKDRDRCAFCRAPAYKTDKELRDALEALAERGNASALAKLGFYYDQGINGVKKDMKKALDMQHKAARMGDSTAAFNLACRYRNGDEVKMNSAKAKRLFVRAAKFGGRVDALGAIGHLELKEGRERSAVLYWLMAASGGDEESLANVKKGYTRGFVSKDELADALRSFQAARDETKSNNRDLYEKMEKMGLGYHKC